MFGPNVKSDERSSVYYHHRGDTFHTTLKILEELMRHKFGLDNYNFLFITGSGSFVNEMIIYSFQYCFNTLFSKEEFGHRLLLMETVHEKNNKHPNLNCVAYPLYETSMSQYNSYTPDNPKDITFLDMVSAFPYYLPPNFADIWTTVSSKQLGSYPVLGIIALKKDLDIPTLFRYKKGSCLNLIEHLTYYQINETRNTPALPLYYDLMRQLEKFDRDKFVIKINNRRKSIIDIVGPEYIIGNGPVITFRDCEWVKEIAKEFDIYKGKKGYQVFLWSGSNFEYDTFYRALERAKNG